MIFLEQTFKDALIEVWFIRKWEKKSIYETLTGIHVVLEDCGNDRLMSLLCFWLFCVSSLQHPDVPLATMYMNSIVWVSSEWCGQVWCGALSVMLHCCFKRMHWRTYQINIIMSHLIRVMYECCVSCARHKFCVA